MLSGWSACAQTSCGPSSATRRKAPDASAMSCEQNSRSHWCRSDDSRFTRTTGGSRQVKRASRSRGSGFCVRRHLYHQWNEEGRRRSRKEAGPKAMTNVLSELLPQTPLGARTRKAKSSNKPRSVEEEAVPLIRDQMGSPHLRQFNVCNTMRVNHGHVGVRCQSEAAGVRGSTQVM